MVRQIRTGGRMSKRALVSLIATVVVAAGVALFVQRGAFAAANLALHKSVTVSSTENTGTAGGNAVDGNTSTRWSSSFGDPQWITVDLGSVQTVGSVRLYWERASARSYKIQTSDDNATWTDQFATATGAGGVEKIEVPGSTGRYVRMVGTRRNTGFGYSLFEFEVYGTGGGSASPSPSGPAASPSSPGPTTPPTSPPPSQPAQETVGTGDINHPAQGPAPRFGSTYGTGFTLVKNWNFGANGTVRNMDDMSREFLYHDQFGTIANGTAYGALTAAPDAANALSGQPVNSQVRAFTGDSLRTTLIPTGGATTIKPDQHHVINGSFMAKWGPPSGGSRLGRDILWETRVRYVTPQEFWFALWNSGNRWDGGAEFDVVEAFGYDNRSQGGDTNFDGRFWHADPVGAPSSVNYGSWEKGMASVGISKYDPTAYHAWALLYKTDNTFQFFVDGVRVQWGTMNWTLGGGANGTPIDFRFLFDASWGHTRIASVNYAIPASELDG